MFIYALVVNYKYCEGWIAKIKCRLSRKRIMETLSF